jgi:hypothetical protein
MSDEAKVRSRPRARPTRSMTLRIYMVPGEWALLTAAAEASSMQVSSWVRHRALRAAAGISKPPGPLRPPAARPSPGRRTHSVCLRFTSDEYEAIVNDARAYGLSIGGLSRHIVLGCKPIAQRSVVLSAIAAVHRAGTSLLQLIHLAGDGNPLASDDLMRAVTELRDEIHALRDALLRADAEGASDPAE